MNSGVSQDCHSFEVLESEVEGCSKLSELLGQQHSIISDKTCIFKFTLLYSVQCCVTQELYVNRFAGDTGTFQPTA